MRAAGTSLLSRHARAAARPAARDVCDLCLLPRSSTTSPTSRGPFADKRCRGSTPGARRVAALYRRRGGGRGHPRAAARRARASACGGTDFLAVIDGMQMDAETRHRRPRPRRRSTSIATAWPPPSGGSRCARSATPRRRPTAWRTISAARCSSPTSCATWPRMPRAAGSICRASSSTRPACRTIRRRRWRARGSARCARRVAALAHEHFRAAHAAMARCDRRAMQPGAADGRDLRRPARPAGAPRLGRIRTSRVSLPAWQKLWIALRYGLAAMTVHIVGRGPRRARGGARRSPMPGMPVTRLRGRPRRRRALPLLFRPRARLPHRQRQPPAALRQPRRLRLSRPRSARATRWAGRREPLFPFLDLAHRRALDAAAQCRPPALVGARRPAGACPARARATTRPCCALRRAGAGRDTVAALLPRGALVSTACSSRSPSRR